MTIDLPLFKSSAARIDIRKGFERAIKGATLAGNRVHRTRIFPIALHDANGQLRDDVLPAILIFAGDEERETYNAAPVEHMRRFRVWVEVIAQLSPAFDDVLDTICAEVESVVDQDERLGERCERIELPLTQRTEPVRDGGVTLGSVRLGFDVVYHTQQEDEIELPSLHDAAVEWDLAPPDAEIEATDEIELQP